MKKRAFGLSVVALAAGLALSSTALAVDFPEAEPNDTKYTGNAVLNMAPGDTITGNTTGTSTTVAGTTSSDNYLITVAAPPSSGIWRYRLVLSSTIAGHTGTLRGLATTGGTVTAGGDVELQASVTTTTPARYNQWYGLGATSHQIYYRVGGGTTTTADYTSTLERTQIIPTDMVGAVAPGTVVIRPNAASQTAYDTDFWVYDSNFNPIPAGGRDDPDGTGVTLSLSPGTYYIGIGDYNVANTQPNSLPNDFLLGNVADFPNVVVGADATISSTTPLTIEVLDSTGTSVLATGTGTPLSGASTAYTVQWFRFVVAVPTGPTLSNCSATPTQVTAGNTIALSTTASIGTGGGTITSVQANLTSVGGGAAVNMTPAGGGVYNLSYPIPASQATGTFSITLTATDSNNRTGSCSVSVQVVGANDVCSGAATVNVGTTVSDNSTATTDSSASCQTSSNKDLWFSFTAATAGAYRFDTEGSAQTDTVLSLLDSCGGTELACDDDSGTGFLSSLTLTLTAGQNVKIRVASFGTAPAGGGFNLNINPVVTGACCNTGNGVCTVTNSGAAGCGTGTTYLGDNSVCSTTTCPVPPPPANDDCANAQALTLNVAATGSNAQATSTDGPAPTCQTSSSKGVWFTFTPAATDLYGVTACGSTQDTILTVFTLTSCADTASYTQVGCDDDTCDGVTPAGSTLASIIAPFTMNAGTTYYIRLSSFGTAATGGSFTVTVTGTAPVTGACCATSGTCSVTTSAGCTGSYQGDNSVCSPNPCPQSGNGRCCVGARCTVATDAAACTALASGPTGGLAGSVFTSGTTACNATGNFTTPCCYANYNKVGGITVQDIFDFLSGWFSNSPNANVEGTGGAPTVQDIFDFLAAWFTGGCS